MNDELEYGQSVMCPNGLVGTIKSDPVMYANVWVDYGDGTGHYWHQSDLSPV